MTSSPAGPRSVTSCPSAARRSMRRCLSATPLWSAAMTIRTVILLGLRCCRGAPGVPGSADEVVGGGGEDLLRGDRLVEDLLVDGVPDELVDHRLIGGDPVGHRVGPGDLGDPLVHALVRPGVGDGAV